MAISRSHCHLGASPTGGEENKQSASNPQRDFFQIFHTHYRLSSARSARRNAPAGEWKQMWTCLVLVLFKSSLSCRFIVQCNFHHTLCKLFFLIWSCLPVTGTRPVAAMQSDLFLSPVLYCSLLSSEAFPGEKAFVSHSRQLIPHLVIKSS